MKKLLFLTVVLALIFAIALLVIPANADDDALALGSSDPYSYPAPGGAGPCGPPYPALGHEGPNGPNPYPGPSPYPYP